MSLNFIEGNSFSLRAPPCHFEPQKTNWVYTDILMQTTSTVQIFEALIYSPRSYTCHQYVTWGHFPISSIFLSLCQHHLALVLCGAAAMEGRLEVDCKEHTHILPGRCTLEEQSWPWSPSHFHLMRWQKPFAVVISQVTSSCALLTRCFLGKYVFLKLDLCYSTQEVLLSQNHSDACAATFIMQREKKNHRCVFHIAKETELFNPVRCSWQHRSLDGQRDNSLWKSRINFIALPPFLKRTYKLK